MKINSYTLWEHINFFLGEKLNVGTCEHCPCIHYEKNYFDGDYEEWCDLGDSEEFHWFCLMPYWVKKLLIKREQRKYERFWEKIKNDTRGSN